jgi:hypothetical protein
MVVLECTDCIGSYSQTLVMDDNQMLNANIPSYRVYLMMLCVQ